MSDSQWRQGVERRFDGLNAVGQGVKQERIAIGVAELRRGVQRIPNAQIRRPDQFLVSQQVMWCKITVLLGDLLL